MKYFTEPTGQFVIKIPVEWQYQNIVAGYKEESPFSFVLYDNPEGAGAFQISCFPANDKTPKNNIQPADKDNLQFLEKRMDDDECNMHLWFCSVEDHVFMAKYIYGKEWKNSELIKEELKKVKHSLSKLVYISEKDRGTVFGLDKYEKFQSALAASFDLKKNAVSSGSMIEFIIVVANQIDAYLRLCIVMKTQLNDMTNSFDFKYFYQGDNDKAIMERKIYKKSHALGILSDEEYDQLENLYKKRNKIVHRYVISELKTKDLAGIAYEYEILSEHIRLIMKELEDVQKEKGIGIYKDSPKTEEDIDQNEMRLFFAGVNDKHLVHNLNRDV